MVALESGRWRCYGQRAQDEQVPRDTTRKRRERSTAHQGRAATAIDRDGMRAVRAPEGLAPRSAAKRIDVLTAAWDLFATHGFADTGMREVAAAAGVSTATIYAHFPTKRDLLRALVTHRWEAALIGLVQGAAEIADPLERLLFAVTTLNRGIAADPLLCQLLVTPRRLGEEHLDDQVGRIEDMMDARCAELIRASVAAGRLKCADPDALAVLLRISMQGWLLTEARRPRPMSEARITASLVSLLRGAMSASPKSTPAAWR